MTKLMTDEIFVPENSKPGIMLSGGADSSLLLWMLINQNVSVSTFTIERKTGVLENSKKIIDWINDYFNSSVCYPIEVRNATELHNMQVRLASREIFKRNLASHLYFGITQNPPVPLSGNIPVRNPVVNNSKLLTPFWNFDKRDILRIYRKYNIMDLFNITQSCQLYTNIHCGSCFHCLEREWGFINGI